MKLREDIAFVLARPRSAQILTLRSCIYVVCMKLRQGGARGAWPLQGPYPSMTLDNLRSPPVCFLLCMSGMIIECREKDLMD